MTRLEALRLIVEPQRDARRRIRSRLHRLRTAASSRVTRWVRCLGTGKRKLLTTEESQS